MENEFTLAVTGDSIINRRVSVNTDEKFLSLVKVIRDADLGYGHFEGLIHDYDGPEVYPSAVAGFTPMRAPRFVADELKWLGFDIVSHASNHCMDYSYGGLFSTWKALDEVGLPYAGTGMNMGDARSPVYLDTAKGRVALISMCSSFSPWARAGEARRDVKGRPGLNSLRFYHIVNAEYLETLKQLMTKIGWEITQRGKTWLFNPRGQIMSAQRFMLGDQPGVSIAVDEADAEGNLRAIKDARRQADWVLVHLHNHECDPNKSRNEPPDFIINFSRSCIDAGADVFIGQGSHAQPRGIELYKKKIIFYDPGDFMAMSGTVSRLPSDFYFAPGYPPETRSWDATPSDGFDGRQAASQPPASTGESRSARIAGSVIAVCSFGNDKLPTGMKLYPFTLVRSPRARSGMPVQAEGETAKKIIEFLAELSAPFGTKIEFKAGIGIVKF